MIKLIIFDLWQTLAYRNLQHSTFSKLYEESGVSIPKEKFHKMYEKTVQTKKWNSRFEMYSNLCKTLKIKATKEKINLIISAKDKEEAESKLYPHTISMLAQLREKGYKIGILSNTNMFSVNPIQEKTRLLEYIDYPLFSFDAGMIKPDLEFFRKMLKIAGCKPEEAIMIGDRIDDDIEPAKSMGMNAILFKDYAQLKKEFVSFGIYLK